VLKEIDMNHPLIASANGKERLNRMIKDAENSRRVKVILGSQPKKRTFGKLRAKISSRLPQVIGSSAETPA
jgi:hypothetical protein